LTWPDTNLVEKILTILGIHDNVELEFCLNSRIREERLATMQMVERFLPDLTSGDPKRWTQAKTDLKEIYYKVPSSDEEALL